MIICKEGETKKCQRLKRACGVDRDLVVGWRIPLVSGCVGRLFSQLVCPREGESKLLPVGYKAGASHVNVEAFIYPHIFSPAPCFCSQLYLAPSHLCFKLFREYTSSQEWRRATPDKWGRTQDRESGTNSLYRVWSNSLFQTHLQPHLQRYLVSLIPAPFWGYYFLLSSTLCRQWAEQRKLTTKLVIIHPDSF